jgi:hypothetical protein
MAFFHELHGLSLLVPMLMIMAMITVWAVLMIIMSTVFMVMIVLL